MGERGRRRGEKWRESGQGLKGREGEKMSEKSVGGKEPESALEKL